MLLRFTSIFKQNSTNSRLCNQNPTAFCSIFIDYNYLCHIRATAKYHKEEAWYDRICATADYQGIELPEDIRLKAKVLLVPIKVLCA